MSHTPTISSIITVPVAETSVELDAVRGIVPVGLVLDGGRVYWGACVAPAADVPADSPPPARPEGWNSKVRQRVSPILEGRSLSGFREIVEEIDAIRETVTELRVVIKPESGTVVGKLSRRAFLTGRLTPSSPAHSKERITVNRALDPGIRFGVSQALLSARADHSGVPVAELVADEYQLSLRPVTVGIQVDMEAQAPIKQLPAHVRWLGYTISSDDPKQELGAVGEKLQRRVRGIKERLAAADTGPSVGLSLNVCGGLGDIYEDDVGQVLGALYGLEQASRPYPLRLQDPFRLKDRDSQIKSMAQLKSYLSMRRMKLRLAAGTWIESVEDVSAFLEADAAHIIYLNPARFGSLAQTIEAVLACRRRDVDVVLENNVDDSRASTVICHVALATGAHLMNVNSTARADLVHDHLLRIRSRLDFKESCSS